MQIFPKGKFSSKFGHSFSEKKNIATEYFYFKNFMFWQNYGPKQKDGANLAHLYLGCDQILAG
jgi:hypothetical protein